MSGALWDGRQPIVGRWATIGPRLFPRLARNALFEVGEHFRAFRLGQLVVRKYQVGQVVGLRKEVGKGHAQLTGNMGSGLHIAQGRLLLIAVDPGRPHPFSEPQGVTQRALRQPESLPGLLQASGEDGAGRLVGQAGRSIADDPQSWALPRAAGRLYRKCRYYIWADRAR